MKIIDFINNKIINKLFESNDYDYYKNYLDYLIKNDMIDPNKNIPDYLTLNGDSKMNSQNRKKEILTFLKNKNWYALCSNLEEFNLLMKWCEEVGITWYDGDIATSYTSLEDFPLYIEYTIDEYNGIVWERELDYDEPTETHEYISVNDFVNYINGK